MIIPIWQNQGLSSHQLSYQIGQQLHTKATHTGTLDPMAEGVLVVLTGDERFNKSQYTKWRKTYEFSLVCGISTDSFDQLGLIQKIDTQKLLINSQQLAPHLATFIGQQQQLQPTAAASRHNGKSGFELLKEGKTLDKKNLIEIFSLAYCSQYTLSTNELLASHKSNCQKISGDFRQLAIIKNWDDRLSAIDADWLVVSFKATTSKRTYIRSLVTDIGQKIGIPTTTWSIRRTQNGPYTYADCNQLLQYDHDR